jgi:hypothetical protein
MRYFMVKSNLRFFLILIAALGSKGCVDESGNVSVGVSLGGTGTGGGLSVGTNNPSPKPRPDM